MTTQRWIWLLTSSLVVALVAMGWLARPTLCLNSRVVEKLDIVQEGHSVSIGACPLRVDSDYSDQVEATKNHVERRLRFLEQSFDFLKITDVAANVQTKPNYHRIRLSIVETLDPLVRIHPEHIILSQSSLTSNWVLEKAFFISLLLRTKNLSPLHLRPEEILAVEVLSDLMMHFEAGQFGLDEPLSGRHLKLNAMASEWPFVIRDQNDYCNSPWRSYLQLGRCQQGLVGKEDLVVGLRPLISHALVKSLDELAPENRITLIRSLVRQWPMVRIPRAGDGGMSLKQPERQILETSHRLAFGLIRALRGSAGGFGPIWIANVEKLLMDSGVNLAQKSIEADLVVYGETLDDETALASLRELAEVSPEKRIFFVHGGQVTRLPDFSSYPMSWFTGMRARQGVLLHCGVPSMDLFRAQYEQVEKVLLVEHCQSQTAQILNWRFYFSGGVERFVSDNPKMSFIQFHLPSLKTALERKNLNPIPLLNQSQWQNPFFVEALGWQSAEWDQAIQAFRARAAVDAIQIYRL